MVPGPREPEETPPVRLLVVEDDPLLSTEVSRAIAADPGLVLVAACTTGAEALAAEGPVDVAIVDLGLPDIDGGDLIRALRDRHPELEVLVHTIHEDRDRVFAAIVAGAASYVLKGIAAAELVAAIHELRAGGAPMSPKIAREVIAAFQRQGRVADKYTLSARERDVLLKLEQGLSYKEAAAELHLSTHTVHSHIKSIYEKLHASSKRDALAKARLRGIL